MSKITSIAAVLRDIFPRERLLKEVLRWLEQHPEKLSMYFEFLSEDIDAAMGFEAHLCTAVGLLPKQKHDSGTSIYVNIMGKSDLIEALRKLPHANAFTVTSLPFATLASALDICCVVFGWPIDVALRVSDPTKWSMDISRAYNGAMLSKNYAEGCKIALRQIRSVLSID